MLFFCIHIAQIKKGSPQRTLFIFVLLILLFVWRVLVALDYILNTEHTMIDTIKPAILVPAVPCFVVSIAEELIVQMPVNPNLVTQPLSPRVEVIFLGGGLQPHPPSGPAIWQNIPGQSWVRMASKRSFSCSWIKGSMASVSSSSCGHQVL